MKRHVYPGIPGTHDKLNQIPKIKFFDLRLDVASSEYRDSPTQQQLATYLTPGMEK